MNFFFLNELTLVQRNDSTVSLKEEKYEEFDVPHTPRYPRKALFAEATRLAVYGLEFHRDRLEGQGEPLQPRIRIAENLYFKSTRIRSARLNHGKAAFPRGRGPRESTCRVGFHTSYQTRVIT